MRNQHVGEFVIGEILFQPVARLNIKMISRLIQQQQVWFFEQQFRERNAHLPAARKFFRLAMPIFFAKAESREHGPDLRFDCVAVAGAELTIGLIEAVGYLSVFGAGRIESAHARGQRFQFLFDVLQIGEHAHAFGENSAPGDVKSVLRQIARPDAFHAGHE